MSGFTRSPLLVAYPTELDVARWARAHRADERPGQWPYGLDQLDTPDRPVQVLELPADSPLRRSMQRVSRSRSLVDPVLTWDENAAVRLRRGWEPHRHYSGVIWLTDDPAGPFSDVHVAALRSSAATWVLSDAQCEPLADLLGSGHPPIHVVRFGIDSEFFKAAPFPDRPMVLSLGNDRDRDLETLFAAMEKVHRAMPDAEIIVQTRSAVRPPEGVTVVAHASHDAVRALYARATVVAVATRHNVHGSGMTVALEAQAVGRPVVITRTPGMHGYVADGVGGFLVTERSVNDLSDSVIQLLSDPGLGQWMGEQGRVNVERRHTAAAMAQQLVAIVGHDDPPQMVGTPPSRSFSTDGRCAS